MKNSLFDVGEFIAWDGEGVTVGDEHRYIMLENSLPGDGIQSLTGLSTEECCAELCRVANEHPRAIHVMFAAGYDVNMILRDCPKRHLERIWAGEWTRICGGRFCVLYRNRKSFSIRQRGYDKGIVLWDVFGFFQATFVRACEKFLGESRELELVRAEKLRRSEFALHQIGAIKHYCKLECALLVQLMETLRDHLKYADMRVARWDGAGACAASLLRRERTKDYQAESPKVIRSIAAHAYAGGRSEIFYYGHAPNEPVYHYDINSAYPAAMQSLPAMKGARWHRNKEYRPGSFAVYYVRWDYAWGAQAYPFFWRAHDSSVFFPRNGEGWYWAPEVAAAYEAMNAGVIDGSLEILDGWHCEPATDEKPFDFVPQLYALRQQYKKDGIGAEKVLKLGLNSLYGKTAQHVGAATYHQLEWAGWITSSTRALLYRATLPAIKQNAALMFATDGVYSKMPLELPLGEGLGEWEFTKHAGASIVQSGVYWTHNGDGQTKEFCRGFDASSLSLPEIVDAWRARQTHYPASLTRFIGMGSALAGSKNFSLWRSWRTMKRALALTPSHTKRYAAQGPEEWSFWYGPHTELMVTHPSIPVAQIVGQTMSAPYPLESAQGQFDARLDNTPLRIVEQEAHDSEC